MVASDWGIFSGTQRRGGGQEDRCSLASERTVGFRTYAALGIANGLWSVGHDGAADREQQTERRHHEPFPATS
jgi:hypothetical protein